MTVDMKFTGDSNDALAAIAKLERKWSELENKMNQVNKKDNAGKQSADDWSQALDGVAMKYAGIGTAIGLATKAATALVAENQKMLAQIDKVGDQYPELFTKLRIQSGASEADVQNMMPVMEESLLKTPSATVPDVIKLQTQLASSGFSDEDVKSGKALNVMLRSKAATNDFGAGSGKAEDLVQTASMVLKGFGIAAPSADDLEKMAAGQVALFEQSSIKAEDFKQIAPKMAGFKNLGMSAEESLGTFTALAEVQGANKADSGMSNMLNRLSSAGAFKERKDALASIGVKPEEVAISDGGVTMWDALDTLREKMGKVDPVKRNEFRAKFFGEEASQTADILLGDAGYDRAKRFSGLAGDRSAFDRNVETFQESRFASNERTKAGIEFSNIKRDRDAGQYSWKEHQLETDKMYTDQVNAASGPMARSFLNFGKVVEDWSTSAFKMAGAMPSESGFQRDDPNFKPAGAAVERAAGAVAAPAARPGEQSSPALITEHSAKKMIESIDANTKATLEATKKPEGRTINRNGNRE